jgi:hypothetical protein
LNSPDESRLFINETTCEETTFLNTKIKNSATIYSYLTSCEGNLGYEAKSEKQKQRHFKKMDKYIKLSKIVDPEDLNGFKNNSDPKIVAQYCKKAVEQRQWDHIAYLTEIESVANYFSCLAPKPYSWAECKCAEATKLVLKELPKKHLYDPMIHNPSADEMLPGVLEGSIRELRDTIKKSTGRDLDKEPKVYYYKGDPGM